MIRQPQFKQRGQKQSAQVTVFPAPIKGIDTRQAMSHMDLDICIYTFNFIPSSYGATLRKGYRVYADKIVAGGKKDDSKGVRSLMVFSRAISGTRLDDKLFVATNQGIFDVTNPLQPPKLKLLFDITTEGAGYGVDLNYIDEGGNDYMFFADEANGLFRYDGATDTWERYRGINGIEAEDIVFITTHKQRLWVVQRDSSVAWYLPPAAISGAATPFYLGSLFKHGGDLKGLYNWTIDGGSGVDDQLVAVSTTGDVLPYKGEDPSNSDTWSLVGSFYIGETPTGRRITNEFGGNLFILSSYGIIAMADLLKGVDPKDVSANSVSYKVSPLVSERLKLNATSYGWELLFAPSEGKFIINSPPLEGYDQIQFVMDMITEGWGMWRGLPMNCLKEWNGRIYFGSGETLYVMDGTRDGVAKIQFTEEDRGLPIEFSLMTSFQKLGSDGTYKMVQLIRPDFLTTTPPDYAIKAIYDYNMEEVSMSYPERAKKGARWNIARWDDAVWGTRANSGLSRLHGTSGIGRSAAIALKGSSGEALRLISFDLMWKTGGAI